MTHYPCLSRWGQGPTGGNRGGEIPWPVSEAPPMRPPAVPTGRGHPSQPPLIVLGLDWGVDAEARLVFGLLEAGHVILANYMRIARRDAALGVRVGVDGVRLPVER